MQLFDGNLGFERISLKKDEERRGSRQRPRVRQRLDQVSCQLLHKNEVYLIMMNLLFRSFERVKKQSSLQVEKNLHRFDTTFE